MSMLAPRLETGNRAGRPDEAFFKRSRHLGTPRGAVPAATRQEYGLAPTGFATANPSLEYERFQPALGEQECCGGAAPARLAVHDVFATLVENLYGIANLGERNIDGEIGRAHV